MAEPVYRPVVGVARGVFKALGLKFDVTGDEHVASTGGGVVAMNHVGYLDFALVGYAFRPRKRLVRFMAKKEVFDHKISGPLMRGMKHIPVDREAGAGSYRHAVEALRSGELVGVFPEATISQSFELKEFKSGAVRMAQAAGVPVLPMIIWGSQRVWTKGYPKRLGRSKVPITLSVGEPVPAGRKDNADELNTLIRASMTELLHAAQEAYPAVPSDELKFLPVRLGGTAPTLEQATALDEEDSVRRAARREAAG